MAGSGAIRVRGAPPAARFSPPHAPLKRSLTVGTWSGWTDVVMTALLRRVSPELRHATFDVANYVDTCISEQFSRYNIQQVRHGWYGGKESWPELGVDSWDGSWPANFSAPVVDFCLIDGGHSYTLASRDFKTLRTGCRVIAFHDIVNVRVGLTEVPRLWRELTDPTHERSAPEFESVNCTQQPRWGDGQLMGIGLLVRKEGAAGRWQYPPPEQKPFPLDPADALARRARLNLIRFGMTSPEDGEADSEILANARGPWSTRGSRSFIPARRACRVPSRGGAA